MQMGGAAAAGGAAEAADVSRLARALVAAYERGGRTAAVAASGTGAAADWHLRTVMADDSFFSNAADWSFGGPGAGVKRHDNNTGPYAANTTATAAATTVTHTDFVVGCVACRDRAQAHTDFVHIHVHTRTRCTVMHSNAQ
jgi:hypothetical protein